MKVGQKVVCIADDSAASWKLVRGVKRRSCPVHNEIYTVQDMDLYNHKSFVSLKELHPDDFFDSKFFRPVDEAFGEEVVENLEKQLNLEPAEV